MSGSIFISHSARDTPARTYLDAISPGLHAAGFDVWLDETRLKGGDDWRVVIANWMAECHGAVALFSTAALEREYFRFEISNLFARWTREQADAALPESRRFRFCPLVVPPLTMDDIEKQPLVRATHFGVDNWIVPTSPGDALARLLAALGGLDAWPSPLEALEGSAAAILGRVRDRGVYEAAARDAGFAPADLGAPAEYPTRLARLLLRCPIDSLCAALLSMGPVLGRETVMTLFQLLAPSWVSFEAGCRFDSYLCVRREAPPADRFAVIGGAYPSFTPLMYLLRARRNTIDFAGHIVPVPGPEGGGLAATALLRNVHAELARFVLRRFANPPTADTRKEVAALETAVRTGNQADLERLIALFIKRIVLGGRAVVVVARASEADFDLIAAISTREELRQVTFVAVSDFERPLAPHDARYITPEHSPEHEDFAYNTYVGFAEP